MVVQRREQSMTVAEFDHFADLPENQDKILEFIEGEVYEVPSSAYASHFSAKIIFWLMLFLHQTGLEGYVTTEAGGFMVNGWRYAPDVAYISKARQPELAKKGYNPNPPELAVEVQYPVTAESERMLRLKLFNYLAVGTMVWVVYPEEQRVEVYAPGEAIQILGIDDTLNGGAVLPGFTLELKQLFAQTDTP